MVLVPGDAPPLVFVGPSAPASDVHSLLPEAEVRPPVRRGDLYQARLLRYSVFVIIDGVFAQREAISPREVVDVLQDGAAVVGASSMGALRAVDCYPAGAEGIGVVYRLFRTGVIDSEDEVAVVFDPDRPYPALSEPLVGVRCALGRAVRHGLLDRRSARRVFESARSLPYAERSWPTILAAAEAGSPEPMLRQFLAGNDVKRSDARAALRRLERRREQAAGWFRRLRRSRTVFVSSADSRERRPDSRFGRPRSDIAPGFLVWMLLSGRANRYPGLERTSLDALMTLKPHLPRDWFLRLDTLLWSEVSEDVALAQSIADRLEDAIDSAGACDAEHFRHAAMGLAIRRASCEGATAAPADLTECEARLLNAHRMQDLTALAQAATPTVAGWIAELHQWWSRARASRRAAIGS